MPVTTTAFAAPRPQLTPIRPDCFCSRGIQTLLGAPLPRESRNQREEGQLVGIGGGSLSGTCSQPGEVVGGALVYI